MDLFESDYSRVEFSFVEKVDGVRREASIALNNEGCLRDVVIEFRNFLHAMGYTYVDAVVVVKDAGGEVSSED